MGDQYRQKTNDETEAAEFSSQYHQQNDLMTESAHGIQECDCESPSISVSQFLEGGVFMEPPSQLDWDRNAQVGESSNPGAGGAIFDKSQIYWVVYNDGHCMIVLCCTTQGAKDGVDNLNYSLREQIKIEDMKDETRETCQSPRESVLGDSLGHVQSNDRVVHLIARVSAAPKIADDTFFNSFRVDSKNFIEDTLPIGYTSPSDTAWARSKTIELIMNEDIHAVQQDSDSFLDRGKVEWAKVQEAKNRAVLEKETGIPYFTGTEFDTDLIRALVDAEVSHAGEENVFPTPDASS